MNMNKTNQCHLFAAIVLLALFGSVSSGLTEEPNDVRIVIAQRIQKLRTEGRSLEVAELVKNYGFGVVAPAEFYLDDSEVKVRLHAFGLIRHAGLTSKVPAQRQQAVDKLLRHVLKHRKDGGIEDLLAFKAADFSKPTKQKIINQLETLPNYDLILLVGAADANSALPKLKTIVDNAKEPLRPFKLPGRKKSHRLAFAALMSRARMGVKEDIQRCIQIVESHEDEDFRVGTLLKRLSYVRQPEVVEYIKGYLFMDKVEPGSGGDIIPTTYAQRAAIALNEMLKDFPGTGDATIPFNTLEGWTAYMRDWMNKQQKWNIIR